MRQDTFIEAHHPDPWQFSLWLECVLFFWQPNQHRAHVWNQINSWSYSSRWLSFLPLPPLSNSASGSQTSRRGPREPEIHLAMQLAQASESKNTGVIHCMQSKSSDDIFHSWK